MPKNHKKRNVTPQKNPPTKRKPNHTQMQEWKNCFSLKLPKKKKKGKNKKSTFTVFVYFFTAQTKHIRHKLMSKTRLHLYHSSSGMANLLDYKYYAK